MADIEDIRRQTQEARGIVEQKKYEVQQLKQQLEQEEKSVPDVTSQQALRQKLAGLQGRAIRQKALNVKNEIAQRLSQVNEYGTDLSRYESQVSEAEGQIQDYDMQQSGLNEAKRLFSRYASYKSIPSSSLSNQYTREYLEQMYDGRDADALFNERLQNAIDQYNSGVPLDTAFRGMNVDFLAKKGFLKPTDQSLAPEIFLEQLRQGGSPEVRQSANNNANIFFNTNSVGSLSALGSHLPRNDRVWFNQGISITGASVTDRSMIPLASAQTLNSNQSSVNNESNGGIGLRTGLTGSSSVLVGSGKYNLGSSSDFISNFNSRIKDYKNNQTQGNIGFTESGQPYNTTTGRLINVYSKGLTSAQQFKQSTSELGYVKGSLDFLGSKIARNIESSQTRGMRAGDTSAFYQSVGMVNLGKLSPNIVYAAPVVGTALAVVGGTETMIKSPTITGKLLGATEAGLGAWGARAQLSRTLGYPRYDTRFVSVSGTDTLKTGAVTKEIGLFRTKTFYTPSYTNIRMVNNGNVNSYMARTRGAIRQLKPTPFKNKPTAFESFEMGQTRPRELNMLVGRSRGLTVRRPIEDAFESRAVSVVRRRGSPDVDVFVSPSVGGSINGRKGFVLSSSAKVKRDIWTKRFKGFFKTGRGNSLGVILKGDESQNVINIWKVGTAGVSKGLNINSIVQQGQRSAGSAIEKVLSSRAMAQQSRDIFIGKMGAGVTNAISFSSTAMAKPSIRMTGFVTAMESPKQESKSSNKVSQSFITPQKSSSRQIQRGRTRQKSLSINNILGKIGFKSPQGFRFGLSPRSIQTPKPNSSNRSGLRFFSGIKQTPKTPRTPIGFIKPSVVYTQSGGKVVKADSGRYVVFVRRFGVDNLIGEAETLEEAKRILRSNLQSNLGRSGYVSSKGKEGKLNIDLGFGFRPSKRQTGRVVQESWFSLGSQSERKEIQRSRKRKSGKKARRINWFS